MRVSILGAGAIAYGMAAYLAKSGHEPMLWSPSGGRTRALAAGELLKATGDIEATVPVRVAGDCKEAIDHAEAVVIALPVNGHRMVMDAAVPHLVDGLPVIVSSHGSFGALYISKQLAQRNVSLPIVVWGTTLLTGRQQGPTEVHVSTVRQKIDVATLPFSAREQGYELCTALFGDRFVKRDGMLAIALSNLNPQNHLGIALLNLTRMEKGEQWSQGGNVTPAVGRVIEALDAERLAIADHFGIAVRTVQEHFSLSFHVPVGSVSEMNQEMERQGRGGFGPKTSRSACCRPCCWARSAGSRRFSMKRASRSCRPLTAATSSWTMTFFRRWASMHCRTRSWRTFAAAGSLPARPDRHAR
jgi:opine dehydrogenase